METPKIIEIDKKYAILIGINEYSDDIMQPLRYSVADVKSLYDILVDPNRGGYAPENVRLFIDDSQESDLKPTRSDIMSQISSLASMATTRDNILVYFSGHGIEHNEKCYLLPQDARYNVLDESAINFDWMRRVLTSSNARVKISILDACHSGAIKGKATSGFMTQGFQKAIFPPPEGSAILASCKMSEVSWEDDEMKHGVFSYFLTEGLRGAADYDRNSKITIMEASKYTSEKVSSWALAHSRNQSPILKATIFGDVVLCQVPSDYIPPAPTEMAIETVRMLSEEFESREYHEMLNKVCGLLINFVEPDSIIVESEDAVKFPEGEIIRKTLARQLVGKKNTYMELSFNYETKNRKNVDAIASRLDDSKIVGFDTIVFHFSHEMNLAYIAKSFKKRGFNVLSFDPTSREIKVELPSELHEEGTTVTIEEREKGVSMRFYNRGNFSPDFYDRINPKSVMELSISIQK